MNARTANFKYSTLNIFLSLVPVYIIAEFIIKLLLLLLVVVVVVFIIIIITIIINLFFLLLLLLYFFSVRGICYLVFTSDNSIIRLE